MGVGEKCSEHTPAQPGTDFFKSGCRSWAGGSCERIDSKRLKHLFSEGTGRVRRAPPIWVNLSMTPDSYLLVRYYFQRHICTARDPGLKKPWKIPVSFLRYSWTLDLCPCTEKLQKMLAGVCWQKGCDCIWELCTKEDPCNRRIKFKFWSDECDWAVDVFIN